MPRSRPDVDALFSAFSRVAPLSTNAQDALAALLGPRSFPAGAFLLRAGQHAEWSFFIVSGLVRELYIAPGGQEHTRTFVHEGQFTGSLLDLVSGAPAVTFIEALEPTTTLAFSYRAFDQLCERHPELSRAARRFTEQLYVRKASREHAMLALSAGERHALWLRENPGLDRRIRRQHLASYLGITPEHLSRLRKRSAR